MREAEGVERVVGAARRAGERAYAPYSSFPVGAAVLCADGRVFEGCNVENAAFGLTICAERVALFSAVAAGCQAIEMIAISGPDDAPLSPCGACRQVMLELAPNAEVIMEGTDSRRRRTVRELLPDAFDDADLGGRS